MNIFSDPNKKQQELEEKELLAKSLLHLFKGDAQLIAESIPEFHQDEKVQLLLNDFRALQQRIYDRWVALGFSEPVQYLHEPDHEKNVEDESKEKTESEYEGIPEDASDKTKEIETLEETISVNEAKSTDEAETTDEDIAIVIDLGPADTSPSQPPAIPVVIPKRIHIDYPNGKVDQPYSYTIPTEQLHISLEQIQRIETKGFMDAGLVLDQKTWEVEGFPEEQGQFPLEIILDYTNAEGRKGQLLLEGNCNINPDPRSLWQEHEPPADAPYPKSHTDAVRLESDEAILIGASRRGRSHAHKGDFRDDDFQLAQVSDTGWYILAVADGAGSAKYSREGSRLAVEITTKGLEQLLDEEFTQSIGNQLDAFSADDDPQVENSLRLLLYDSMVGSIFDGYKAILSEANEQGVAPRDYATTLLVTVTRKFAQGWFFASYWVGDGCIGVYRKGESVQLLGTPDGGEFAGQTRFFTMADIWNDAQTILGRLQFALVPDFTALCLMTDGISDPKFQTDYNLRQVPRWDAFWEDLQSGVDFAHEYDQQDQELLEWLNFWSQGDHDDRSLVIMYPKESEAGL